ncbi:MAG: Sapep family Mn(2+)-dependent dipeptidase [Clostridia bacterium]|nr:Sapep family Mn(2+)-dependent dipeptidase [Clostridia bacterium]
MNEMTIKRIEAEIEQRKEAILADLFRLVKIPSIESAPEENAPFGKACREALDTALSMFAQTADSVKDCGGVYGLAIKEGDEKSIGLFGHLDVVPVSDGWIYNAPFTPQEHDGFLVGRGISDNKAGVIMSLYALKLIKELNLPLKSTVKAFLGCNEESGMEDIAAFVREQKVPEVNIIPDGAYPMSLGEKGIFHLFAKATKPLSQILAFEGGMAVNVILGECTVTLKYDQSLLSQLQAFVADKDTYLLETESDTIVLSAKGITAHGSRPEGSRNAGKMLLDALFACPAFCAEDKAILTPAYAWLSDDYGAAFGINVRDEHFGSTTATNGIMHVQDGIFGLSFDIRYGTAISGEEVYQKVENAIKNAGYIMAEADNSLGFCIDENSAPAKAMIGTYKLLTGQKEVSPIYMSGGTYARYLPCAFSIGTELDLGEKRLAMPVGHGDCHQSDECISVKGFLASIKMLVCMILAVDEALHESEA